jgi:hypothetical protein
VSVVLFLDFDGVTHPEPCYDESVFCRLSLIEEVLLELPPVEIVISSSWRDKFPLEDMRDFFVPALQPRVIGVTSSIKTPSADWLPGHVPQFERQWECETWMNANKDRGTPWVAIDDRSHWFEPDCRHLLLTDSRKGFQAEHQALLREMFQERL